MLVTYILAGCATLVPSAPPPLPALRLAPGDFGGSVSLVQRLSVRHSGEATQVNVPSDLQSVEALIQIDPSQLRVAGFVLGQRVFTFAWDGVTLSTERYVPLPEEANAARVLRDLQLAYWPAQSIRAALPAGWSLDDSDETRSLIYAGTKQVVVHFHAAPHWAGPCEFDNRREGYLLVIESARQAEH
jgi:hypothetical protein